MSFIRVPWKGSVVTLRKRSHFNEKEYGPTDNGHHSITIAHHEHYVLRWAKNNNQTNKHKESDKYYKYYVKWKWNYMLDTSVSLLWGCLFILQCVIITKIINKNFQKYQYRKVLLVTFFNHKWCSIMSIIKIFSVAEKRYLPDRKSALLIFRFKVKTLHWG